MNRIELSSELTLLVRASLGLLEGANGNSPTPDWDRLLALAQWHQVRPLTYEYLKDQRDVPDFVLENLKEFTLGQAVTNMAFLGICVNLFSQLRSRLVDAFPMKGAVWAWILYERPGLREFGDIDFFVSKDAVQQSLAVLLENGFAPDEYRDYLMHKRTLAADYLGTDYQLPLRPVKPHTLQSLEIQWNCSYPRYQYNFSWAELMQDPQEVTLMGTKVAVPRMENQLIMLIVHHAGVEQWDKLKYMADFIRLLRTSSEVLDWKYIHAKTREKGFNKLLLESLGVASVLTGEDFLRHSDVSSNGYPSQGFVGEMLGHWERGRPVLKTKTWRIFRYNVKYRDNWSDKLAVVAAHLTYLLHWRLLWHKMNWYRSHPASNKVHGNQTVNAMSGR